MVTIPKAAENSKAIGAGDLVIKVPECNAKETLIKILEKDFKAC